MYNASMDTKVLLLVGAIAVIVAGLILSSAFVPDEGEVLGTWEGSAAGTLAVAVAQYFDAQGNDIGPYVSTRDLVYDLRIDFTRDDGRHLIGEVTVGQHDQKVAGTAGPFLAEVEMEGDTLSLDAQAETTLPGSPVPVARAKLLLLLTRKAGELLGTGSLTYLFLDESGHETQVVDAGSTSSPEGSTQTFREIVLRRTSS